jgi:hypothetical protein
MTEASIVAHITTAFAGVETTEAMGATFCFVGDERMMPFATLVTSDEHDDASDLHRPGVFRLNIGVGKGTFESLFGPLPKGGGAYEAIAGFDYAALDRVMPHPVYGRQYWVCVLNPSEGTFEARVKPLLAEAYARAARRGERREGRGTSDEG